MYALRITFYPSRRVMRNAQIRAAGIRPKSATPLAVFEMASLGKQVALLLDRLGVAKHRLGPGHGRGPARGVGDHAPDLRVEVGRVALVARPEVEDLAAAARVAAAAAEDLAALEPANEHQRLGRGDVEALAVHLLLGQLDRLAQASRDRVAGLEHPDPLVVVGFAPLEVAGGAHQAPEDL